MKRISKLTALLLSAALLLALAACGPASSKESPSGNSDTPTNSDTPNSPDGSGSAPASGDSYTFGYNNFGQGAYPLDLNESTTKYAWESMGMKMTSVNNQFTVDKLITDAQNQITQGVDGMVFWSAADTLFKPKPPSPWAISIPSLMKLRRCSVPTPILPARFPPTTILPALRWPNWLWLTAIRPSL